MDEIRTTLAELNRAWLDRRFADLGAFFAEDIVMRGPALKPLLCGREALVKSYADFMAHSNILEYSETSHATSCWGEVGTASYDWAMTWEQNGKTDSKSGQELIVFERRQGRWIALLRIMLF